MHLRDLNLQLSLRGSSISQSPLATKAVAWNERIPGSSSSLYIVVHMRLSPILQFILSVSYPLLQSPT
jgi:hypothetical protein